MITMITLHLPSVTSQERGGDIKPLDSFQNALSLAIDPAPLALPSLSSLSPLSPSFPMKQKHA